MQTVTRMLSWMPKFRLYQWLGLLLSLMIMACGASFTSASSTAAPDSATDDTDLVLHVVREDIGEFFMIRTYLENVSDQNQQVLSANLASLTNSERQTFNYFPDEWIWERGDRRILLKESLTKYEPVVLEPGEIAVLELDGPTIETSEGSYTQAEHGTIIYEIPEEWARLHDTWAGEIEAEF